MKRDYEKMSDKELLIEQLKWLERIEKKLPDNNLPTLQSLGFTDNEGACAILGVKEDTMAGLRNNNIIRFKKVGKKIYYKLSDLIEMLHSGFERK